MSESLLLPVHGYTTAYSNSDIVLCQNDDYYQYMVIQQNCLQTVILNKFIQLPTESDIILWGQNKWLQW